MTTIAAENTSPAAMTGGKPGRMTEGAIYRDIYNAILDHRLPPGTKLPEDSVGEIFGVSWTVMRGTDDPAQIDKHRRAARIWENLYYFGRVNDAPEMVKDALAIFTPPRLARQ